MSAHENLIKIFEYALNQEETGKSFFQHSLKRMGMGAAVTHPLHWENPGRFEGEG